MILKEFGLDSTAANVNGNLCRWGWGTHNQFGEVGKCEGRIRSLINELNNAADNPANRTAFEARMENLLHTAKNDDRDFIGPNIINRMMTRVRNFAHTNPNSFWNTRGLNPEIARAAVRVENIKNTSWNDSID